MDSVLSIVVTAAAAGTKEDRKVILKALLNAFPDEELESTVQAEVKRARRRRFQSKSKSGLKLNNNDTNSYCRQNVGPIGGHSPLVGPSPPIVAPLIHWTQLRNNVVSFDCEFVDIPREDKCAFARPYKFIDRDGQTTVRFKGGLGKMKYKQKLAIICIVDYDGNVLFNKTVRHEPETYKSDYDSRSKNGITYNGLATNGTVELETVQKGAVEILKNKFIVTKSGSADFESLGEEVVNYSDRWFDLNNYYKRSNGNPFKLKNIHDKIFGISSFQETIHSAYEDAIATLKVFKHLQNNFVEGSIYFDENLDIVIDNK